MSKKPFGVLILHGFTASLDCVREIQPPFTARGIPTRMPVLRGHNAASPEALRGVTWHDWVADAGSALQDLETEVDKVIVVGHSMGGLVALTLAADYPNQIDSLVLAAAAVQLRDPLAPGNPLSFTRPLVSLLVKKWPVAQDHYADMSLAKNNTNYLWAPMDVIISFLDFTLAVRKRLPEVNLPMLLIYSRNDTTVDAKSVDIICSQVSTPQESIKVVWFEKTEHEMFRDCERGAIIDLIANYVIERIALQIPPQVA